jgi:hypothetical protein
MVDECILAQSPEAMVVQPGSPWEDHPDVDAPIFAYN